MMNRKMTTILKNGGLFLILLVLTIYMVLRDNSLSAIRDAVLQTDYRFLLAGVGFMCLFLFCEGINIARCLRLFEREGKIGIGKGVKYALIGFFFSSVTPSASGGQPMQLYYMHKDGIKVSHGTLALLFELLSFQTVTICLAAAGYLYQRQAFSESLGNLQYFLLIGVALNAAVMAVLVCAVFSRKMIGRLAGFVVKLVKVFSRNKAELLREKLSEQIEEYSKSAVYLKEHKVIFIKTLATTIVQILSMYTVPYFVYRSFGLSDHTMAEVIAMQAVLYVAVSALPLPGAMGISESTFLLLFQKTFSAGLLPSAMVLTRGINFYLFVLISGAASAVFTLKKKGQNHGVHYFSRRRRQGHSRASEALFGKQRI